MVTTLVVYPGQDDYCRASINRSAADLVSNLRVAPLLSSMAKSIAAGFQNKQCVTP